MPGMNTNPKTKMLPNKVDTVDNLNIYSATILNWSYWTQLNQNSFRFFLLSFYTREQEKAFNSCVRTSMCECWQRWRATDGNHIGNNCSEINAISLFSFFLFFYFFVYSMEILWFFFVVLSRFVYICCGWFCCYGHLSIVRNHLK